MSEPPKVGDTVRMALASQRWTLKRIAKMSDGVYGVLERPDGKGTVIEYQKLHSLVKVDD